MLILNPAVCESKSVPHPHKLLYVGFVGNEQWVVFRAQSTDHMHPISARYNADSYPEKHSSKGDLYKE